MKPVKSIVIGTAGHIDHGKTALVRALTGVDTDRLPEEKRRGITIDLGFAAMDATAPDGSAVRISFVDVPGHALFIRNMLAGAGCVPAVMLVIAADEGVMPQTREHLAICELLGICDGFTVISKADLVSDSRLEEVRAQIGRFLEGSFLGGAPILAGSAQTGDGIASVRSELASLTIRVRAAESTRPMRLPIDRTFVKKGFGTVVTGTLLSGEMRIGQMLALEPGGRKVRVRGLQTHGQTEETAVAGTRVAVNLAGVETSEISRGQTLVMNGGPSAVEVVDAEIRLLEGAPALRQRARVHLHAFTSETMATVSLYGNAAMKAGETRLVRLKLANPIVLAPGDRFVLRQPLPAGTIGGGRVLDGSPMAQQRRGMAQAWLEMLSQASMREALVLRVRRRGSAGIRSGALALEMGLNADAAGEVVGDALQRGELIGLPGELLLAPEAFQEVTQLVLTRARNAGEAGLKRSELQSQTGLATEILEAVIEKLISERGLSLKGEAIALTGAEPGIANRDAKKMQAVSAAYQAAGLAPASVREVAERLRISESEMRRLVTLLIREKMLIRMGDDDMFVHATAVKDLAARLAPERGKTLDVGAFKALTGLTRKHAIPLLELLDRERITRKHGEVRVVL